MIFFECFFGRLLPHLNHDLHVGLFDSPLLFLDPDLIVKRFETVDLILQVTDLIGKTHTMTIGLLEVLGVPIHFLFAFDQFLPQIGLHLLVL